MTDEASLPPVMAFWGVGPKIGTLAAIHFVAGLLVDHFTQPLFRIPSEAMLITRILGSALILLGIALYLFTLRHLHRAWRQARLITTGPYRRVRHPLYAIGLFLLCPGFCLWFPSWLIWTTPLTMAAAVCCFVRKEEATLLAAFGDDYRDYQNATPSLVPRWAKQ